MPTATPGPASPEAGADRQLVVIGSSAGGIEALSALVKTLPAPFPVPIVLAQHVDPRRTSHLAEILARQTPLPVQTVEDAAPLNDGVIYVVPANRHVEISDHHIRLRSGDVAPRPNPSVDLLFRTAAETFGERLIAVVLTGTGTDGAAGARDVKALGGTVVIQNPATAAFPGMPLAISPTDVDVVANLEAIGPLLHDLATGAYAATRPDDERALRALLDQLRDKSGIDFTTYKQPTIMRRLQRRMAAVGVSRLREYVRYVQRHPEEYQRLVSSFLIKVTDFFRDADLFQYLRESVLPDLIADARDHGRELRFWSAGCATGEEAYSLAILVSELLGDEISQFTVRIFATDLDGDAVAYARRGIYAPTSLEGLPQALVARYFTPTEAGFEIKKAVRGLCIFGQHDLGQRAPFPRIDLAFRNVLIYFTPELQKRALQLFAFSLREGGYLALGKAETTSPLAEYFALEQPRLKVYRRQGSRVLIPAARIRDAAPLHPELASVRRPAREPAATGSQRLSGVRRQPRSLPVLGRTEDVLAHVPVGVLVVDARYDIVSINNAARHLLGIHGAAIGEDLLHTVDWVPSHDLRTMLDAAFRGEARGATFDVSVAELALGELRCLRVETRAYQAEPDEDAQLELLALITLYDVTSGELARREAGTTLEHERAETQRLNRLLAELSDANSKLTRANEELNTVNAELRTANEELLVANEEAQAANEEVETLNEELQASNEELETLNEELQATVEELNTTNDDLQARSVELQDLAASLEEQSAASEAERTRLITILSSLPDPVLAVDRTSQVLLSNTACDQLFGAAAGGLVARGEDGQPLPDEQQPRLRAARGEAFTERFYCSINGQQRQFEAISSPVPTVTGGGWLGGVILIRELVDA